MSLNTNEMIQDKDSIKLFIKEGNKLMLSKEYNEAGQVFMKI